MKAYPTSSDIFQSPEQSSKLKLVDLFCHDSVKRDLRILTSSFALGFGKCHCKWDRLCHETDYGVATVSRID